MSAFGLYGPSFSTVSSLVDSMTLVGPLFFVFSLYRPSSSTAYGFGRSHSPRGPRYLEVFGLYNPINSSACVSIRLHDVRFHATFRHSVSSVERTILVAPAYLHASASTVPSARQPSASSEFTALLTELLLSFRPLRPNKRYSLLLLIFMLWSLRS